MKKLALVLVASFSITFCIGQDPTRPRKPKDKDSLVRYITNWNEYKLPVPVKVTTLKDILQKIAMYKKDMYCPFGINACSPHVTGLTEIVQKIVSDSIAEFEHKENVEEQNVDTKALNLAAPKGQEIDFDAMRTAMSNILHIGSSIHNKSLDSARNTLRLMHEIKFDIFESKH